jgi:predicted nucleotidyltransferase
MVESWRLELLAWANRFAQSLKEREDVLGVIIGGSLARGQEWRHSDLEIGILVAERIQSLPYFNISEGRGVEILQLVQANLMTQVELAEAGDVLQILNWPIQLWAGKIDHDPSGLLTRFKQQFDANLYAPAVIQKRIATLQNKIGQALAEARELLANAKPAAALVKTRGAMNEAILALHWAQGELPRSQNRTDSRLRLLCRRHNQMPFYALYREVFALSETSKVIHQIWPRVKDQVLEITRLWGDPAREFFVNAVDSNFEWRQNAGILTVYRLYVPIIGSPGQGIFQSIDDLAWAEANADLMHFLGLAGVSSEQVEVLIERLELACKAL